MDKKQLINIIEPILVNWLGNLPVFPSIDMMCELIADRINQTLDKGIDKE